MPLSSSDGTELPGDEPLSAQLNGMLYRNGRTVCNKSVCKRLEAVAAISQCEDLALKAQILRDPEALDSTTDLPDVNIVPNWAADACVQLVTVIALFLFAFSSGIIVGALMTSTSPFISNVAYKLEGLNGVSDADIYIFPAYNRADALENDAIAQLQAQFTFSASVMNVGLSQDSISSMVEMTYIPSHLVPDEPTCFPTDRAIPSDPTLSFFPSMMYMSGNERDDFVGRNGLTHSVISLLGVKNGEAPGFVEDAYYAEDISNPIAEDNKLNFISYFVDEQAVDLLKYSVSTTTVGPTPLVRSYVPFITGLYTGISKISLYSGTNIIFLKREKMLIDSIIEDCKKGHLNFAFHFFDTLTTAMFYQQDISAMVTLPFSISCHINNTDKPVSPPSYLLRQSEMNSLQIQAALAQNGQKW